MFNVCHYIKSKTKSGVYLDYVADTGTHELDRVQQESIATGDNTGNMERLRFVSCVKITWISLVIIPLFKLSG